MLRLMARPKDPYLIAGVGQAVLYPQDLELPPDPLYVLLGADGGFE